MRLPAGPGGGARDVAVQKDVAKLLPIVQLRQSAGHDTHCSSPGSLLRDYPSKPCTHIRQQCCQQPFQQVCVQDLRVGHKPTGSLGSAVSLVPRDLAVVDNVETLGDVLMGPNIERACRPRQQPLGLPVCLHTCMYMRAWTRSGVRASGIAAHPW